MSKTSSRILWIIVGVLLVVLGVYCLMNPDVGLLSLSLYFGLVLLFSGIIDIIIYTRANAYLIGSGWFLADGVLTVLLSLFLLFNQQFTILTLPFIFGFWLLMTGINQFINSIDLRAFGIQGWGWLCALGILLTVVGFFSFLDPIPNLLAINALVGILLICKGIGILIRACMAHKYWKEM